MQNIVSREGSFATENDLDIKIENMRYLISRRYQSQIKYIIWNVDIISKHSIYEKVGTMKSTMKY